VNNRDAWRNNHDSLFQEGTLHLMDHHVSVARRLDEATAANMVEVDMREDDKTDLTGDDPHFREVFEKKRSLPPVPRVHEDKTLCGRDKIRVARS